MAMAGARTTPWGGRSNQHAVEVDSCHRFEVQGRHYVPLIQGLRPDTCR
jgi:hypothetical protein